MDPRQSIIEAAFADRTLLADAAEAVRSVIDDLDRGNLRVASQTPSGEWNVHAWVKRGSASIFWSRRNASHGSGPF